MSLVNLLAPSQRRIERVSQAAVTIQARDPEAAFKQIREILLCWIEKKVGHSLPPAMVAGETDALDQVESLRTETAAFDDPVFWSFRRDDHDPNYPQRTWVTEASLALYKGSIQLGYRLHLVNRGEPAPFQRSIPGFMRDVAKKFVVQLGRTEIELSATPVEFEHEIESFLEDLCDPSRTVPIIAISPTLDAFGKESYLLDADRLAAAVFGTAYVKALSRDASFALTDKVGKQYSVFNGAARLWRAGQPLEGSDPYHHPLFLAERIRDETSLAVARSLGNEVLRISAGRRDAEQIIPSFAEIRRLASEWGRDKVLRDGGSASELLPLYEADNQRLSDLVNELKLKRDELLDIAEEEAVILKLTRDEARSEVNALRQRLSYLHDALRSRAQLPGIPLPADFDDLEDWSRTHLGDRVHILPRALSSTFRILGCVAEGVRKPLQEGDGDFDHLGALARHG